MKYTCSMETVQQNGRFILFSSKFHSNIYSILYVYYTYITSISSIYIIKLDILIYVPNSRPNGWIEWADIFLWILIGSLGVTKAKNKKNSNFIFLTFFSTASAGSVELCLIIDQNVIVVNYRPKCSCVEL